MYKSIQIIAAMVLIGVASAFPSGHELHAVVHPHALSPIGPSGIVTGHGASGPSGTVTGEAAIGPSGIVTGKGPIGPTGPAGYGHGGLGLAAGHGAWGPAGHGVGHGLGLVHGAHAW